MAYADTVASVRTATHTVTVPTHLLDMVTMLSPFRTPLLSVLPRFQAEDVVTEWVTDELASEGNPVNGNADVQAIAEDTDASFEPVDDAYKLFNRQHGFRETLSMSTRRMLVKNIDSGDYYKTQMTKKLLLQAKRIEFALIHSRGQAPIGSGNAASPGAKPSKMFGLQQIARHLSFSGETGWSSLPANLQGTVLDVTESPCKHFLETHLGDILTLMRAKGAEPTDLWLPMNQKRSMSDFLGASTRNIQAEDRALIHTIDVYEGPTGVIITNIHDMVEPTAVLVTQTDLLELAVLEPTVHERLAKIGDAARGMVETVLTLVVRCPAAVGKIIGLCETYDPVTEAKDTEYA